jgi:hypothetical protein
MATSPPSCATCRTWAPVVLLREGEEAHPEHYPTCGRIVPIRLVRVYELIQFDPTEPPPDVLAIFNDTDAEERLLPNNPPQALQT